MAIVTTYVSSLVKTYYTVRGHEPYIPTNIGLDKSHTYVCILSNDGNESTCIDDLKSLYNVLLVTDMSVNRSRNHGMEPRNTVVVLEFKECG